MIIIGKEYRFTSLEVQELEANFGGIDCIDDRDKNIKEIIGEAREYLGEKQNHIVVLNMPKVLFDAVSSALSKLEIEDLKIMSIALFLNIYLQKCYIDEYKTQNRVIETIGHFRTTQYIIKRLIDFIGVAFITFFSIPVMLYSIYRIKKESPEGGVIYSQKRVGLDDKEFICYKFRSMPIGSEGDTPQFASKDDKRAFPWGETMRKARFDELPQLWNVIRGDMHLIGPRPERKYWVDKFEKTIPYYAKRHCIRPGITGWAQIKYPYGENEEDARHKLSYDLYYIKRWSIKYEFSVVWNTIFVVLGKRGV